MAVNISKLYGIPSRYYFNPLSPKSDQHQIAPCDINAL